MIFQPTLLSNLLIALNIPVIVCILQSFVQLDPSLTALCITFVWLAIQKPNGSKYAIFVLLIPYSIGIFAAIYQVNLSFNIELLSRVLLYGERGLASINSLDAFYKYYCPISIMGFALNKRMRIIDDLARYGLWDYSIVRKLTAGLIRVLVMIDMSNEIFIKITHGLKTRYIDITGWHSKMVRMNLWAPRFLQRILLTELAHHSYLKSTGISVHKIQRSCEMRFLWEEKVIALALVATTILYFTIL